MADAIQSRYSNGNTKDQQLDANRRYLDKQKHMRSWVDDVAASVGLTRDQLLTTSNAELVAQLLKFHATSGR